VGGHDGRCRYELHAAPHALLLLLLLLRAMRMLTLFYMMSARSIKLYTFVVRIR
jgi:hypothetical protein